jgi:hypothetical protein
VATPHLKHSVSKNQAKQSKDIYGCRKSAWSAESCANFISRKQSPGNAINIRENNPPKEFKTEKEIKR